MKREPVRSAWTYDEVGNRTGQYRKGVVTEYAYSDTNELLGLEDSETYRPVYFTYDDNGNLTEKTSDTESWQYKYDNQNRLVEVCLDGEPVVAYAYDVFGRRIKAAEVDWDGSTSLTIFVYSGIGVTYEEQYTLPSGTLPATALSMAFDDPALTPTSQTEYVRGNGQLVAKIGSTAGGEVVTYYHQDHLGSTRAQTNESGTLMSRADYEPFGLQLDLVGERYSYTGQYREDSTNLYYYGARFYDPSLGRFLTPDSWSNLPDDERGYAVTDNPSRYNRYAYALNDPLGLNDPIGHDAIFVTDRSNVGGKGHMFIVVVYKDGTGMAYSWSRQGVTQSPSPLTASDTATPEALAKTLMAQGFLDGMNGISDIRFSRTRLSDTLTKRVQKFWTDLQEAWWDWYNFIFDNCADKSIESVKITGAEVPSSSGVTIPNTTEDELREIQGEQTGNDNEWCHGTGGGGKYMPSLY